MCSICRCKDSQTRSVLHTLSQLAAIPRQPGQDIGYRSQAGDIRGRAGAASTHLPHPGRQQGRGRRVQNAFSGSDSGASLTPIIGAISLYCLYTSLQASSPTLENTQASSTCFSAFLLSAPALTTAAFKRNQLGFSKCPVTYNKTGNSDILAVQTWAGHTSKCHFFFAEVPPTYLEDLEVPILPPHLEVFAALTVLNPTAQSCTC